MKYIFLSDYNFLEDDDNIKFINTKGKTITDCLFCIEQFEKSEEFTFIIYAELLLANSTRAEFNGIELAKHIKLTPLKNDFHNNHIQIFHWLPFNSYIEHNVENLLLYAPGFSRFQLPGIKKSRKSSFYKDKLKCISDFIFDSEEDVSKSKHVFSNEISINQFKSNMSKSFFDDFKSKPIWFKKIYLERGYKLKNLPVDSSDDSLRILLIDDLAEKWIPALKNIWPNGKIDAYTNILDFSSFLEQDKEKLDTKRNEFEEQMLSLINLNSDLNEIKKSIMSLKTQIHNQEQNQKKYGSEIEVLKDKLEENNQKLKRLVTDLSSDGGLIEVLIDYKENELFKQDSKKGINLLNNLINDIIKDKKDLKNKEKKFKENSDKIESNKNQLENLKNNRSKRIKERTKLKKESSETFENLFSSDYDILLLDMHLTEDSEKKSIEESDGYEIMKKLKEYNFGIPTIIFSASSKNTGQIKKQFSFLEENQFLKGITPPSKLIEYFNAVKSKNVINNISKIIEEIHKHESLWYRTYTKYDSPDYNVSKLSHKDRSALLSKLKTIKGILQQYHTNEESKNFLTPIISTLGDILRELRFTVDNTIYDRHNSIFYVDNIRQNRIKNLFADIVFYRNKIVHNNINDEKYRNWFSKLDLSVIQDYVMRVSKSFIFDE